MTRERWDIKLANILGKETLTSDEANIAYLVRHKATEACIVGFNTNVCPFDSGPYRLLMQEAWYMQVNQFYQRGYSNEAH